MNNIEKCFYEEVDDCSNPVEIEEELTYRGSKAGVALLKQSLFTGSIRAVEMTR